MAQIISSPIKLINKKFNQKNQNQTSPIYDLINDVIKFIPLATLMALLYGNLRIFIYYTSFNINIYDFVNFDELLKFAIRDIIPAAFVIGAITIISELLKNRLIFTFILSIVLILVILTFYIFYPSQLLTDCLQAFIMITAVLMLMIPAAKSNPKPIIFGTTIVFLIVVIAFNASLISYTLVTHNLINTGDYIVLKSGKKILSDSNLIYIGKTTDYVFFYDKNLKNTTAFRLDEVSRLSVGYSF